MGDGRDADPWVWGANAIMVFGLFIVFIGAIAVIVGLTFIGATVVIVGLTVLTHGVVLIVAGVLLAVFLCGFLAAVWRNWIRKS